MFDRVNLHRPTLAWSVQWMDIRCCAAGELAAWSQGATETSDGIAYKLSCQPKPRKTVQSRPRMYPNRSKPTEFPIKRPKVLRKCL